MQMAVLAGYARSLGRDQILMGDFNNVPWSDVQAAFRAATWLDNRGPLVTTWPAQLPAPLRVPIDSGLRRRRAHPARPPGRARSSARITCRSSPRSARSAIIAEAEVSTAVRAGPAARGRGSGRSDPELLPVAPAGIAVWRWAPLSAPVDGSQGAWWSACVASSDLSRRFLGWTRRESAGQVEARASETPTNGGGLRSRCDRLRWSPREGGPGRSALAGPIPAGLRLVVAGGADHPGAAAWPGGAGRRRWPGRARMSPRTAVFRLGSGSSVAGRSRLGIAGAWRLGGEHAILVLVGDSTRAMDGRGVQQRREARRPAKAPSLQSLAGSWPLWACRWTPVLVGGDLACDGCPAIRPYARLGPSADRLWLPGFGRSLRLYHCTPDIPPTRGNGPPRLAGWEYDL